MHPTSSFSLFCVLLSAATVVLANTIDHSKVVSCSASASSASCSKGEYCLAANKAKGHCTAKLAGGKLCTKDEACKSSICFIAKKTAPHAGKRVCADEGATDFALKDRCTQSKQCRSGYCSKGYCATPVKSSAKCSKDAACSKGASCLDKPTTFLVYDAEGNRRTRHLEAGHCSYVANLGKGMKCSKSATCWGIKFECSTETHRCVEKPLRAFGEACTLNDQCFSKACTSGACGCSTDSECEASEFCSTAAYRCLAKRAYPATCRSASECISGTCLENGICACTSSSQCKDPSTEYCSIETAVCEDKGGYADPCGQDDACDSGACESGSCTCFRRRHLLRGVDWLMNVRRC